MRTVLLNFSSVSFAPERESVTGRLFNRNSCDPELWGNTPASTTIPNFRNDRVLCIVDGDNWNISARNRGLRVRYDKLLTELRSRSQQVFPVAVITSDAGDERWANTLVKVGWHVVSIPRATVVTHNGIKKIANADADLAFELGALSSVANCTVALIGTGDGDLAISCAAGLKRVFRKRPVAVHTLSIAGATSSRLRSRRDLFKSSILLGMDLLVRGLAE